MNTTTPWDQVSDKFDTYKKEIWYGAADNIDAVWPVFLDYIRGKFPTTKELRALEFGCGTGMFCRELAALGLNTRGIDISPEMIKIGRDNLNPDIRLQVGDTKAAKTLASKEGKFNLITSIMVLQFIADDKLDELAAALAPKGHLIFAGHNPHRLTEQGITNTFTLSDTNVSVPIYKRLPVDYDKIFAPLGLTKTLENFTQSSPEFLTKYNITRDQDIPKYMILAYQKN